MKAIFLRILILFFLGISLQNKLFAQADDLVYMIVEQKAMFPGGANALEKYLENSIKYPKEALKKQTEGKVYVRFVVRASGEIANLKVLKGIGDGCDEEALKVIGEMPKWTPAKQGGEKVASYYTIPIEFLLKKIPAVD